MVCKLSEFLVENSQLVDIGCSTGTLLRKLHDHYLNKKSVVFQGIDIVPEMISKSKELSAGYNINYEESDPLSFDMTNSDMIISYYTLQFIHPSVRQLVVSSIYDSLGGVAIFRKGKGSRCQISGYLSTLYNQYKLSEGYSHEAILNETLKRSIRAI